MILYTFQCPSPKSSHPLPLPQSPKDCSVQGPLKSLLQHHNLKASILWHSDFFMVQLSHLYITTGKTMALTI